MVCWRNGSLHKVSFPFLGSRCNHGISGSSLMLCKATWQQQCDSWKDNLDPLWVISHPYTEVTGHSLTSLLCPFVLLFKIKNNLEPLSSKATVFPPLAGGAITPEQNRLWKAYNGNKCKAWLLSSGPLGC